MYTRLGLDMKKIVGLAILVIYYFAAIYTAVFDGYFDEIVLGLIPTIGTYLFMSKT